MFKSFHHQSIQNAHGVPQFGGFSRFGERKAVLKGGLLIARVLGASDGQFFEESGFGQIARERIANGQTAGLPLNEDGTLVEF